VSVTRVVLASASPRRSELLRAAGVDFVVDKPDVDESVPDGLTPEVAATMLAERKARVVAQRRRGEDVVVLAADTMVAVDVDGVTRFLGKPADAEEARAMLRTLSTTRHRVVTGVCALRTSPGARPEVGCERTWVTMRRIEADEIERYVESEEWRDKAGGYAIQENADQFVTRLEEGGFDNVVGLPVRLALELVSRAAALAPPTSRG